jgi:hypothetical protein
VHVVSELPQLVNTQLAVYHHDTATMIAGAATGIALAKQREAVVLQRHVTCAISVFLASASR